MERKNLSDKHKLKYSDTKPILKEILKGLLYIEKKQTDIGRRKSQLKSQCTYRLKKKKNLFVKATINILNSKRINMKI